MEKDTTNRDFSGSLTCSSLGSEVTVTEGRSEEVRRFSLGGLGAVSKCVGVSGCDTSDCIKMPPASVKRNRRGQGVQHPAREEYYQSDQVHQHQTSHGPGLFPFQPARRRTTFTSHPPLRPITTRTETTQRKVRNSTSTMDYMPSPDGFCAPDFLKATYTTSPSSLCMYEQDRPDLHAASTLLRQVCPTPDLSNLAPGEPDFDLHPQFENSNSLEGFFRGALGASVTAGGHLESSHDDQRNPLKQELGTISQQDLATLKSGPTLAKLNFDPFAFEDSDVSTFGQEAKLQPVSTSLQKNLPEDSKRESLMPGHPDVSTKTFTPLQTVKTAHHQSSADIVRILQQQSQHSPTNTSAASLSELLTQKRNQNVAVVSPIHTTTPTTTIKTEPKEVVSAPTDSNPCLHRMLSSSPQHPLKSPTSQNPAHSTSRRRVMPVVGQSRPPSLGRQGKSGSVEEKWKEIEKFIHDPNSEQPQPAPSGSASHSRKRKRHGSDGSTVMSDEESAKLQRTESITDDDSDSDDDSDISDTPFEESLIELAKKSKQYFWQYNIQAKGPKGTRLQLTINDNDPHHPSNFEDPVFDPSNTSLVGIRHGGKARKGDGNEVSPNPRKLFMIGQKLCKLNRDINNVQLSSSLPASVRSKSRKEKNKLSSRACRLKKKAQHEANKIKLFGLTCEQGELLEVVRLVWPTLRERAKQQMKENIPLPTSALALHINNIIKTQRKTTIAGNTADYVNQAIARVEEGDPSGGLPLRVKVK